MRKTIEKHIGSKKYRDKWIKCIEHGKYKKYGNQIYSTLCSRCSRFWGNPKNISKNNLKETLKDAAI